ALLAGPRRSAARETRPALPRRRARVPRAAPALATPRAPVPVLLRQVALRHGLLHAARDVARDRLRRPLPRPRPRDAPLAALLASVLRPLELERRRGEETRGGRRAPERELEDGPGR